MAEKKWMQRESKRQEKAGTKGSLREVAKRRGLLSGKEDTLTKSDLDSLERAAKRMKKKDGTMTDEGLKLFRKVQFARRAMKAG